MAVTGIRDKSISVYISKCLYLHAIHIAMSSAILEYYENFFNKKVLYVFGNRTYFEF